MSTEDIFNEGNIPESTWFAFEKVGDNVAGVLAEDPVVKVDTSGQFGDQKVFKLRQEDGSIINVGIKMKNNYVIERTSKVRTGDKVGFKFAEEIESKVKGHHPAKSIQVYVQLTPEGDQARGFEQGVY